MKRSYLYVDPRGADIYYSAPGNVSLAPGSKGTVVVWAYAGSLRPGLRRENRLLRIVADPNNEGISALCNENFCGWAMYSGTGARTFLAPSDYASLTTSTGRCGWQMMAVSWDMTLGKMRVFVNGSYDGGWQECGVPAAEALRMYVGPKTQTTAGDPTYLQYVAAWAGNLTGAQVAALYAQGPRYVPVAEDGAGEFTFLATFNEGYGAEIASGDGEMYTDLAPAADRYARLDDGQREFARQTYFLGQPHHDGRDFDRAPVWAIFHPGFQPDTYTTANLSTEGQIIIAADSGQSDNNRGPMAPGARISSSGATLSYTPLRALQPPCTFRARLRLNSDAAPTGERMRLGPVDYVHYPLASANVFDASGYGSYQSFSVEADAGNTQTHFATDLNEAQAGFWNGAYCLFVRGANAGRALKVAGYDAATGTVTLECALPNVPVAGDLGVAAFWARLQGVDATGAVCDWQNLEVILDETHGSSAGYMPEVDFAYVADNTVDSGYTGRFHPNYVRYDRGRTVIMEGLGWGSTVANGAAALYGRPAGSGDAKTFSASLRIAKIEVSGPWQYQLLRAEGDEGPSLADNFMVWTTVPGEQGLTPQPRSVKVWRQQRVHLQKQAPEKFTDPAAIQASFKNTTWRAGDPGVPQVFEENGEQVIAAIVGRDAGAVPRIGYIAGTWDGEQGMPVWADEEPPAGKANPFFEGLPMGVDRAPDAPTVYGLGGAVVPMPDGKWMLAFAAKISDPDHSQGGLLVGAEDRWSFDRERHWLRDNPLMGIRGGVDVPKITGGGTGTWANRDGSFGILYDPHTEYPARRYLAYARGKSIVFGYTKTPHDVRPMIGLRSADGRVWSALPEGREITPLCAPEHSVGTTFIYDDGAVALSPKGGNLRISEDGVHWQELFSGDDFLPADELPGEGHNNMVLSTFRLGDQRIYYYSCLLGTNMATLRYGGETYYDLADGETAGLVETAAIERKGNAWDRDLIVNVAPGEGQVIVEVVDATTERVIAGYGEADCETVPNAVEHPVRWGGLSLAGVTAEYIRLRFRLKRTQAQLQSPKLYSWRLEHRDPPQPLALNQRANGLAAPAGVTDPSPTFSWTYSDPRSLAQTAHRVLVASTQAVLDAGVGDVWDSGIVAGGGTQVQYAGPTLNSYQVYFWKALVRNSEGVWSG